MPAATNLINVMGAVAKLETTYATAVTLSTTADGLLLSYADRNVGAPLTINYAYDGKIGMYPGNLGMLPLSPPGGKSFTGDLPVRFKGGGAAYSTTVKPQVADFLLSISGFTGTLSTTTTVESYTYIPTVATAAYKSGTMDLYARGEKWPLKGVIGNWAFTFDNPGPPTHTFSISGIANGDVTSVTLPTITYPNDSAQVPNANGVTLVIGSFTTNAVMYSGSFRMNRTIEPRVALTSGTGHEGFIPGGISPEFTFVVADTAFVGSPYHTSAGLDPIKLREAATAITVSTQFGSTQYNRWKVTGASAQLLNVVPTAVNREACWELTFAIPGEGVTVLFD